MMRRVLLDYRERRILAGLIHPYTVRLLDVGKLEHGEPYFGTEILIFVIPDYYLQDNGGIGSILTTIEWHGARAWNRGLTGRGRHLPSLVPAYLFGVNDCADPGGNVLAR